MLRAGQDIGLDDGALAHAQRRIPVEVVLLYLALLDGDFSLQRGGKAEDNAAFQLLPDQVGIHGETATEDADDPVYANFPVLPDRDLSDIGDHAAETGMYR